jgi:hypothetical protein
MSASQRNMLIRASALALVGGIAVGVWGLVPANAQPQASTARVQAVVPYVSPASVDQASTEPDAVVLGTRTTAALTKVTRDQVIKRALTWHPHTADRVPYSQNKTYGGYRTDCSGYASMALSLPKPGPNTVGLATSTYTSKISMSSLKKGDLVIDAQGDSSNRHVVIFEKWANSGHTSYWAYEQRGGYGTDHRTRTYGLSSGSQYHAYRPKNIS